MTRNRAIIIMALLTAALTLTSLLLLQSVQQAGADACDTVVFNDVPEDPALLACWHPTTTAPVATTAPEGPNPDYTAPTPTSRLETPTAGAAQPIHGTPRFTG